MLSLKSLYLSCALAAFSTVPAFATTVIYTDKVTWQNASAGLTTIGFDVAGAPTPGSGVSYTTGLVLGGATFQVYTSPTMISFAVTNPVIGSWSDYSSGSELYWSAYNTPATFIPYLQITLPQAVTSASIDLMGPSGTKPTYNVALNNLSFLYTSNPTSTTTRTFFGITSDVPFTSIAFQLPASGSTPLVDNFAFGTMTASSSTTEAPEACTFLLIASGLIFIARWGRRWTKAPVLSREALPALS